MPLTGLLPLDKPLGMRSTRCVEIVRAKLGKKNKTGHGGTLDSTASGLLMILVGYATRLSDFVMDMPKCYEVEVQLGSETSTDDASGEVTSEGDFSRVDAAAVDSVIPSFLGWRMQKPPVVSAVHVDGERAHKLAREGRAPEIAAKPVYFASVERSGDVSPSGLVSFRIRCRKGTYIRSFARDVGSLLGCGAHVQSLRRVSVGPFLAEDCVSAQDLENMDAETLSRHVLPISSLLGTCATYEADEVSSKRLVNGLGVRLSDLRRRNFGEYSSTSGLTAVTGQGIFSLCSASRAGGTLELAPSVNIIDDRGN